MKTNQKLQQQTRLQKIPSPQTSASLCFGTVDILREIIQWINIWRSKKKRQERVKQANHLHEQTKKYPNGKTNFIQLTKFGFYVRWQFRIPVDFTDQMSPCVKGSSISASGDALELFGILWLSQSRTFSQIAVQQGFKSSQKCCHQVKSKHHNFHRDDSFQGVT